MPNSIGLFQYMEQVAGEVGALKVINNAPIVYQHWLEDKSISDCAEYLKSLISE